MRTLFSPPPTPMLVPELAQPVARVFVWFSSPWQPGILLCLVAP